MNSVSHRYRHVYVGADPDCLYHFATRFFDVSELCVADRRVRQELQRVAALAILIDFEAACFGLLWREIERRRGLPRRFGPAPDGHIKVFGCMPAT